MLVGLPRDVDAVIAIGLAKPREARFDSAADFAHALEHAARGELSQAERIRAAALLGDHPWGSSMASDLPRDRRPP